MRLTGTTTGRLRIADVSTTRSFISASLVPPDVIRYELQPDAGALGLSGVAAHPLVSFAVLTPKVGALAVQGRQAGAGVANLAGPFPEDLELMGYAPTLRAPQQITPQTADVGIVEQIPYVNYVGFRKPVGVALGLSGQAPSLRYTATRTPSTAALTLAGTQSTLKHETFLQPATGALQVTGIQGELGFSTTFTPSVGAITLSGKQPTTDLPRVITPVFGEVNLVGDGGTTLYIPGPTVIFDGTNDWLSLQFPFVFNDTYTGGGTYNLRTRALAAGWSGYVPLLATVTINAGAYCYSDNVSIPAFDVGTMVTGSTLALINNGYIMGRGGNGANYPAGTGPQTGGDAIRLASGITVTITNGSGFIGGGGGGGGGGYTAGTWWTGGGGGAGGGHGGNSKWAAISSTERLGGAGGGTGSNGSSGSAGSYGPPGFIASAAGGGRKSSTSTSTGASSWLYFAGTCSGGGGGGGGALSDHHGESTNRAEGGVGSNGGVAGYAGVATGSYNASGGGGGGGWGAAGGALTYIVTGFTTVWGPGAGGYAVRLNGASAPTWVSGSGAPNRYGVIG